MRFWWKSEEEKKRLQQIKPFQDYILQMIERKTDKISEKVTITGKDPREDYNKTKYMFKVASVYSFLQAKYVDHVYIFIRDKFNDFKRLDTNVMKLDEDDLFHLTKFLVEWM